MWDRVRDNLKIALTSKPKMSTHVCKELLRISKIGVLREGGGPEQFRKF